MLNLQLHQGPIANENGKDASDAKVRKRRRVKPSDVRRKERRKAARELAQNATPSSAQQSDGLESPKNSNTENMEACRATPIEDKAVNTTPEIVKRNRILSVHEQKISEALSKISSVTKDNNSHKYNNVNIFEGLSWASQVDEMSEDESKM